MSVSRRSLARLYKSMANSRYLPITLSAPAKKNWQLAERRSCSWYRFYLNVICSGLDCFRALSLATALRSKVSHQIEATNTWLTLLIKVLLGPKWVNICSGQNRQPILLALIKIICKVDLLLLLNSTTNEWRYFRITLFFGLVACFPLPLFFLGLLSPISIQEGVGLI